MQRFTSQATGNWDQFFIIDRLERFDPLLFPRIGPVSNELRKIIKNMGPR